MLSGDKKTVDITGSTNDNLCDSLAFNFESTRVAVGTTRNDDTGNIKIYNYDPFDSGTGTANTWVLAQTITGNSSSKFGKSTDMNYDGNRIVVGAPGENKVYVYDATSTSTNEWATYVSNTITGTSSSDFGWSVSIAKDKPSILAIGSPSENKVYMYELSGSTWSQTWSNVATDVPNLVPLTATTDVCMTSNNASYGYSVDLATFGRFLAIGAPGVLTTITSSNSTYTGSKTFGDSYYDIESIVYGATGTDTGNIYQRGYIRCFKTSNVASTWQNTTGGSGITSLEEVTQHGQLVYGSTTCHLGNFVSISGSESWSLPGLGFSISISFDGSKLVGGEPFFSVPGHQASIHKGKVRAWIYDDTRTSDNFQELTSSAATWFGDKFGYAVKLDYDGGRLAVGSTKRWSGGSANESEDHGGVHVFDFSETAFYEVSQGNNDFSDTDISHVAIAITNGKTVACGVRNYTPDNSGNPPSDSGIVRFYNMILTQTIIGNTLTGGYLAADSVYIGPNDNSADNSFTKRLSFGGTFNDNKYEAAEIENRSYSTDLAHEGHSELFLVKKSVGSGGTGGRDMIRIKANEIQLHNYITRGHSTDDDKHDMFPRLTMSEEGNFKLNPEFLYGRKNSSTHSSCDVKALLDINGDTFCRGKLNAGHKDRSNTRGFDREQGLVFYDTRDRDIINGTTVYSNVHMTELQRQFTTGTISDTVTYNDTESAFKIGTDDSYIHNTVGGYTHGHQGLKLACWIKLTKDNDQYSSSGETILSAGDLGGYHVKCQIYNGGIQLKWGSGYTLKYTSTPKPLTKDKWHHLFFYIIRPNTAQSDSNNYLYIDGSDSSITWNSWTGSTATLTGNGVPNSSHDHFYVGDTHGDSIVDAYIGMVHARNTHNDESYCLDATDLYTNGPPSERLSVGGDAHIEQKLGIANVSPMYPLDVTGDINFTGTLRQNNSNLIGLGSSSSAGAPLQVFASKFTSNTSPTNNGILLKQEGTAGQHAIMAIQVAGANSGDPFVSWDNSVTGWSMGIDNSDDDKLKIAKSKDAVSTNTEMTIDTNGKVGIGTTTPSYLLDVNGDINMSSGSSLRIGGVAQSFGGGGSSVESDASYFYVIVENSKFGIDGTQQPTLTLYRGVTYRFDQSSSTNGSHPFRISTTAEGGDAPGTTYNGSNGSSGSYRQYIVPDNAPNTVYYNCANHTGMGGTINIVSGITNTSGLVASNVFMQNNVGIGTNSPKAQLHVKREGSTGESNVYIQSYGDSTGDRAALFLGTPHQNSTSAQPKCAIIADAVDWSRADLHFCVETTANNGSAYRASTSNSRMMIDGTSGNVGIGTSSPSAPLHITASGNANPETNGIYVYNSGTASTEDAIVSVRTGTTGGNGGNPYISFDVMNHAGWAWGMDNADSQHRMKLNAAWDNLTSDTKLAIGQDGKVGINHSTPNSTLHIASSSGQTITLDSSTWTSYIHYVRGNGHWYNVVDNHGNYDHNMYWFANTTTDGGNTYTVKQVMWWENNTANAGAAAIRTFTGQHMSSIVDVTPTNVSNCIGLIVSSNQNDYMTINGGTPLKGAKNIHVNEAIPVVKISTKAQDKACFGVISSGEDPNESSREQRSGRIVGAFYKESGDNRVYVNSLGEGGVWVVNTNGNLEAGDYITTSNVSGYGMKQTSEFLANYTVAKITMDCNFNPGQVPVKQIKKVSATNTYYVRSTDNDTCNETFYNTLDDETKALYTKDVRTEMVNDLDSNGVFQWEDTSETELAYTIRYLDANGIETTQGNAVHIAAFVGCTYHCG